MEFNQKLQELRKSRGMTQEELAQALFVSRTAISKWESGRGYPNIESLKAIARFFRVTVDQLLSGDEVLILAEEDARQKQTRNRDLVFGLLDCCFALLIFLPFFGQETAGDIREVSLLALTAPGTWLKILYFAAVFGTVAAGIAMLALQNFGHSFWLRHKHRISALCNVVCVFLFILSRQPYAAAFAFAFLLIKAMMLLRQP